MFGLFDSDLKRVRKLRLGYEDVRQRVLYKMNPYQQYSFISGYHAIKDQFKDNIDAIHVDDLKRWRQTSDEFVVLAQRSWNEAVRTPGIGGEGAVAGIDGLLLLSLQCGANGYRLAEALTLRDDIARFVVEIDKLVAERHRSR